MHWGASGEGFARRVGFARLSWRISRTNQPEPPTRHAGTVKTAMAMPLATFCDYWWVEGSWEEMAMRQVKGLLKVVVLVLAVVLDFWVSRLHFISLAPACSADCCFFSVSIWYLFNCCLIVYLLLRRQLQFLSQFYHLSWYLTALFYRRTSTFKLDITYTQQTFTLFKKWHYPILKTQQQVCVYQAWSGS